jgi:hypothetical protein
MPRLVVDEPNQHGSRTGADARPAETQRRPPKKRAAPQRADAAPQQKMMVVKCIIGAEGDSTYKLPDKKKQ